jgi:hypothetical protein
MVEMRDKKCILNVGRKPKGRRPFRKPSRRWEYNIRMGRNVRTGFIWLSIGTSGQIL